MWDYSWLTRRTGAEAEFADWDHVLDQLVDRGYNCIRLDAFPHFVATDAAGGSSDSFTVLANPELFPWGNHTPVGIHPRGGLLEILTKMKDRGLRAGLSAWFNDDITHRRLQIVTPADFARVWRETLDVLADQNLLDVVEWVDLCNEFPFPDWAPAAYEDIHGAPSTDLLSALSPWSDAERAKVQAYVDDGIGSIRDRYPELRYTVSVMAPLFGENFRTLNTDSLDLAEPHIWLTGDIGFALMSGQLDLLLQVPGSLEKHVATAPDMYFGQRDHWLNVMRQEINTWATWARERSLPLITTEAWGPVIYDDTKAAAGASEWDWVKDVCEASVQLAIDAGWSGICTSNFTEPHFEGIWSDASWHQRLTTSIRKSSSRP